MIFVVLILLISRLSGEELVEMSEGSGSGEDAKIEEMLSLSDEPQSNKTRFLDPFTSVHLSSNISLDQFVDIDFENVELMENLTELAVEFKLYDHANLSTSELTEIYEKAFKNLIKIAPSLTILHPSGGHFFFPDNGTVREIESELKFVKYGLDLLTSLMNKHNLTLADDTFDYIKYNLYLVLEEDAINDTDYYQLINRTFGPEPMKLINQQLPTHSVSLIFALNDVNIKLDLVKFTDIEEVLAKGLNPNKRLDYKEVVSILFDPNQTFSPVPKTKEKIVELLS